MMPSEYFRAYIVGALLALLALLIIAPHAHAAERHHRFHHHAHHNHHRHAWLARHSHRARIAIDPRTGAVAPAPHDPFADFSSLFRPPESPIDPREIGDFVSRQPVIRGASNVLRAAERFIGSRNFTRHRGIPWCASAVNAWLDMTGHPHVASLRAIDALHDGRRVSRPVPGDLVVMRHHVAIFLGFGGRGLRAIGGNQGRAHRVTVSTYPLSRVIAFIRPA
jgi:hypothetical protein